jgi:hypothetical protein
MIMTKRIFLLMIFKFDDVVNDTFAYIVVNTWIAFSLGGTHVQEN